MIECVVIDRQTDRRVFGHQNRDKTRTPHTAGNRVKAILRRQRYVGRQLSEFRDIVLESLFQLRRGNGAHRNRQILLRHIALGTRDNHFFQRRSRDLVIILSQCRQCL